MAREGFVGPPLRAACHHVDLSVNHGSTGGGGGGGGGGDDRRPARPPRAHETEAFSLVTESVFFQLLALLAECLQTVSGGPGTLSGIQGEFRTADVGRIRNDFSNEVTNRHHRPAREVARPRFQLRLADACTVRGAISEDTITFLAFMFFAWLLSQRRHDANSALRDQHSRQQDPDNSDDDDGPDMSNAGPGPGGRGRGGGNQGRGGAGRGGNHGGWGAASNAPTETYQS